MEGVFGWIKSIVCYLCLINLFFQLLPDNSFQKYVRFFAGILLVVIVLGPLADFGGLRGKFEAALRMENLKGEYSEMEQSMRGMEEMRTRKIQEAYEEELDRQIVSVFKAHGLFVLDSSITFKEEEGFWLPDTITVMASYEKSGIRIEVAPMEDKSQVTAEVLNIKKELQEVYNIPVDNINISIQE